MSAFASSCAFAERRVWLVGTTTATTNVGIRRCHTILPKGVSPIPISRCLADLVAHFSPLALINWDYLLEVAHSRLFRSAPGWNVVPSRGSLVYFFPVRGQHMSARQML
uniref:Secreted protein n=1 Tax=Mesocestoides corti TaxID=53468 RepID=A0A5K3EJT9_MESCO